MFSQAMHNKPISIPMTLRLAFSGANWGPSAPAPTESDALLPPGGQSIQIFKKPHSIPGGMLSRSRPTQGRSRCPPMHLLQYIRSISHDPFAQTAGPRVMGCGNIDILWVSSEEERLGSIRRCRIGTNHLNSRAPSTRGNRRNGLRDFQNSRTRARVLTPAALD